MTAHLILLRHTQVDVPAGTCYGQADVPLRDPAEPAFGQVLQVVQAGGPPAALVSSPLTRCALLARHLAQAMSLPLQLEPRWMELHFGAWEGRCWRDIPRTESDPWAADLWHLAPPGGETLAALTRRVHAAMDAVPAAGTTLVVTHAGPMRVALARARGLPAGEHPNLPLPFGGLLRLQARATPAGRQWSETPHP